jgi:periplasmic protein TonB
MILERPDKFSLSSWGISLAVHAVAVGLALAFTAQVKPVLKEEIFKWDVALVDAVQTDSVPERAESVLEPAQPRTRVAPAPVEPIPETIMHRVAPQQTVQMVHPVIEPVKPVEQNVESPQPKAEPMEQKVVEAAHPKAEPVAEAKEPEPVQHAEPVMPQTQPVAVTASPESNEIRPAHIEPMIHASAAASSQDASAQQTTPAPTSDAPPVADAAPVQVAKAPVPSSQAKADHRWLAESLWRRVAELKHYPSSARLNGQEGKVILKAVIRSDGNLAEVSVQKSSGHSILDIAAMEAVKLACPLHMKHAIGKPEIVVSLPIVYSLAN